MPVARLMIVVLLGLPTLAAAEPSERDPWEGFNRKVYAFNDWFDRWVGKPVAHAYQRATPEPVDHAVTHFFNNLGEINNVANNALQGEGRYAAESLVRFVANSTFGVAGLFDVASVGGIARHETGFGTTFGKWGAGSGPYLVLPFLGPSTLRDTLSIPVDWTVQPLPAPVTAFPDPWTRYGLEALDFIDTRADLLQYEEAMIGDRYRFLRDVYLQRRDHDVGAEAAVRDPFLDDDVGE